MLKVNRCFRVFSQFFPNSLWSVFSNLEIERKVGYIDKKEASKYSRMESQNNADEYTNPYPDFTGRSGHGIIDLRTNKLEEKFKMEIQRKAERFTKIVNENIADASGDDYSVYTGYGGIALLNLMIYKRYNDSNALVKAEELLSRAPKRTGDGIPVTFLLDSGPIALSAVISHYLGKGTQSTQHVRTLLSLLDHVVDTEQDLPDECLYGRAGYLYCLLFVRKHMGEESINMAAVESVVEAIIKSGRERSAKLRSKVPLEYEWLDQNYYGAAHGVGGILYMLMQSGVLSKEEKRKFIKPTLDNLIEHRLPSGNYPAAEGSNEDRLIQWCHGAPGLAEVFATAYEEIGEKRYRKAALDAGDVVWERGLCTKGYSLCHGVSGNAYTFLRLYQLTGDLEHLYRAGCFADWCLTLPKHQQAYPGTPYSLFEGLGGAAYLLQDIQNPSLAGFPAFTFKL